MAVPRPAASTLRAALAALGLFSLGAAGCGGVDRPTDADLPRPPPGPSEIDPGSGPYRCDQEAGFEPVPVYDPAYEPTITDYALWPEPPTGCGPDDDLACVCDEVPPPAECLGVVRKPEYIEDFELAASGGAWYLNNEVCELCQKYTDLRVGAYDTAGSTARTREAIGFLKAAPSDEDLQAGLRTELERLQGYLAYLVIKFPDRGLYDDFVTWKAMVSTVLASDLVDADLDALDSDLVAIEARLREGLSSCRDECEASKWPTPVFTKPLPASLIPQGGRCGSQWALNVKSGPMLQWGGTIGLRFGPPLDASEWEGIAFWARVGAGSRTPVRVELSERHTDEKFDEGSGPYCDPLHTDDNTEVGCDKFGVALQLSPDWTFHTIAFEELRQKGWGKQAPYFDVWGLRSMAFQYERGVWDIWIDDLRLYRRAEP